MPTLNLKPTHKPVRAYYESLGRFGRIGVTHETAVRSAFQSLLESCARQVDWTLVPERAIALRRNKRIVVDGALIDAFNLPHGYWEAKDIQDDLDAEVQRKFVAESTARVDLQKRTDMFVIVGNPPYNVGQVNENDNNKNRKYETMDARVRCDAREPHHSRRCQPLLCVWSCGSAIQT